jgi:acetylornithine deacetylase/succinyl-diaminopimelate desuccinylase-like protein
MELESLVFDEVVEAANLGVSELAGEVDRLALERLWHRPTLDCNGVWGGYQGPGSKTIIPSWAKVKISARLVGDQDPERVRRVVTEFVESLVPRGVRVTIESSGGVRPVVVSRDHPVVRAASRAMEAGFGKAPVFIGAGGSIGPVSTFDRILRLPQIMLGVGLPDDHIHAPNEKFSLSQFFGGIKTLASLYDEVAKSPQA